LDPRGAGESDKPAGSYSTRLFAEDAAAFLAALKIDRAHVMGLSLGAATGLWLAARHPEKVKSLSLHSGWTKSDPFIEAVIRGWQVMAKGLGSVTEMVIQGIFPWCFTPELYAAKPDYLEQLAAFVRGRPKQPLDAFLSQSNAVIAHDAAAELDRIRAPTQITFGRHDMVTSTRFAEGMKSGIRAANLWCSRTAPDASTPERSAQRHELGSETPSRMAASQDGELRVGKPSQRDA
jgi:3-oxoadipate enol-lactonase